MQRVLLSQQKLSQLSLRNVSRPSTRCQPVLRAKQTDVQEPENPEKITEKYGLEVGLLKTMTDKNADQTSKLSSAKDLLTKYGSAYLFTSITLSIISFALCYFLIDNGVDVAALLAKIGIEVSSTSEKVGTAALAYAAHKAASPIRFPPTVALTPIVAKYLGKKTDDESKTGQ